MEENEINDFLNAAQSLQDLAMKETFDLEEIIEENDDEINLTTEYPYLIFQRADLVRAMNLCNKMVQVKSDVITYNSISFVPVIYEKYIWFYATNELSHFRYKAELVGAQSEMLDMNISIPLVILQKLVKLMGNKVLIYKKENNLYIRLLDGDLLLDLRQPDENIIFFPGVPDKQIAELGVNSFGSIVNSILPLLNTEIRGEARRIFFTGDKAYYNSSFYYIEALANTPKLALSYRDAEFISKLYKYYKEDRFQLWEIKSELSRVCLTCR